MAKKVFFVLFLGLLHLSATSIFATGEPVQPASTSLNTEACNAPPPDSFRVTSIGGSFVSLAWTPAWINATHTLTVSKKDANGNWIVEYTLPDVPGSSFSVDQLIGGKNYKFTIRTKCGTGEPSELTSSIEHIAAIVELTIAGRNPSNPQPIGCNGIKYQDHDWVGFSVRGEGASSLFEVVINEDSDVPIAYINRVHVESGTIVATDDNGVAPTLIAPEVPNVFLPFQMWHLGPIDTKIGAVGLVIHTKKPPTIDLCPDPNKPMKSGYTFTALTAESVQSADRPGKGIRENHFTPRVQVQNPFKDDLCIFVPQDIIENGGATIHLFDTNGRTVFLQKLDYLSPKVSFPISWFSPGVYILQIKTNAFAQSLRVIKSN